MNRGYVKLFRKTADNGIMKNPLLLQFWVWCLLKAAYKPIDVHVGNQVIHLEPGQFIFGRKSAAEALGSTEMKIRTVQRSLRDRHNIVTKVTNKFTIITICNWELYQQLENEDYPTNNQQITNKQPTNNHKQEREERKEREEENNTVSAEPKLACPYQEIVNLYHATLKELPSLKVLTAARKAYIKARWNEHGQDLKWWAGYFADVKKSDFLCGRSEAHNGRKPFIADLEWLVKPSNMAKVIEGKYKNTNGSVHSKPQNTVTGSNGVQYEF